MADSMKAPSSL